MLSKLKEEVPCPEVELWGGTYLLSVDSSADSE